MFVSLDDLSTSRRTRLAGMVRISSKKLDSMRKTDDDKIRKIK